MHFYVVIVLQRGAFSLRLEAFTEKMMTISGSKCVHTLSWQMKMLSSTAGVGVSMYYLFNAKASTLDKVPRISQPDMHFCWITVIDGQTGSESQRKVYFELLSTPWRG